MAAVSCSGLGPRVILFVIYIIWKEEYSTDPEFNPNIRAAQLKQTEIT